MTQPRGTCCIVLHTHLPWLAHSGRWPVGEEWLHQAWAGSYLPVFEVLDDLARGGRRDVLTLAVTPVLGAMLDDPYLLSEFHDWLGNWQLRAWELGTRRNEPVAGIAAHEHRAASGARSEFERRWRHGAAPVLRELADAGVIELMGGPATHPFLPLLADDRLVDAQLQVGLDDAAVRYGTRPRGIWAPECGYRPGLERRYAAAGVTHFVADGPTLRRARPDDPIATSSAYRVAGSDVVVFGRDLEVTYRVWSPRAGYPGDRAYRDFHTFDHASGFRAYRVTGKHVPPEHKRPYEADRAAAAVERHATDFVDVVVRRLDDIARDRGRAGLVVVAYDTELFGHWWYEGPQWLRRVLDLLPAAGVQLDTLAGAAGAHVDGELELPPGSWGSGKDWRVWSGDAVADLVADQRATSQQLLDVVDKRLRAGRGRDVALDQLVREALLVLASDWAFMQTHGAAVEFARRRHETHVDRFRRLAALVESAADAGAARLASELRAVDGLFGHLDARLLGRHATIDRP